MRQTLHSHDQQAAGSRIAFYIFQLFFSSHSCFHNDWTISFLTSKLPPSISAVIMQGNAQTWDRCLHLWAEQVVSGRTRVEPFSLLCGFHSQDQLTFKVVEETRYLKLCFIITDMFLTNHLCMSICLWIAASLCVGLLRQSVGAVIYGNKLTNF